MASLLDTIRRPRPSVSPLDKRTRLVAQAQAITAAGTSVANASLNGGTSGGRTPARQAWQSEAWGYYDQIPELHYGSQFVGSCLSRITLRLGWMNDANEVAPIFNEDGDIDEDCPCHPADVALASVILGAFRDPLGGASSLLEGIGKNLIVTGECHLLGNDLHDERDQIVARRWEVLSTDEIRRRPAVKRDPQTGLALEPEFVRVWGGGRADEDIPTSAFVLRVYRRHPRWSHIADAPTRPLLEVMEQLALLVRQMRASTLSRLAGAGVLFLPSEMTFPDDETAPEGTEEEDPFVRMLISLMTRPILDRGSVASVVPLVVRADADLIPAIHHLTFEVKDDELALKKMEALIMRFAQGMDLPVEVTVGHQNTTFANAVQVDESTFKAHLEPLVQLICGFLTAGYLWPSLGAKRPVDAPFDEPILLPIADDDVARIVITFDASALVTHQNREQNAIKALEMKPPLISKSSGRRALGFTDADAPTDAERDEWIAVQQRINVKESIKGDQTPADIQTMDETNAAALEVPPADLADAITP